MRRTWITVIVFLLACTAIAAASRQTPRAAYVLICADVPEGVLKTQNGAYVRTLTFDEQGQTAAGPLPPGTYRVEAGGWTAEFTLRTNAAVTQVTGDGWSDGERLCLGSVTSGALTVRFRGQWRWTLEGEGADRASPSLTEQGGASVCRLELPLGLYTLRGPEGDRLVLLTPESPEQELDLTGEP